MLVFSRIIPKVEDDVAYPFFLSFLFFFLDRFGGFLRDAPLVLFYSLIDILSIV